MRNMDEKLADLDTRISAIERNTTSVGHRSHVMLKAGGVPLQRIAKQFCTVSNPKAKNRT